MKRKTMYLRTTITAAGLTALLIFAAAGDAQADSAKPVSSFLKQHCLDCHAGNEAAAGFRLDVLKFDLSVRQELNHWVAVHDRIAAGEMPPDGALDLGDSSSKRFLSTLKKSLVDADLALQRKHGRSEVRRLNRVEYENTLRDLLALPNLDVRELLPPDGIAASFDKSAAALDFSHVQVARYVEVADFALRKAMAERKDRPGSKLIRAELDGIEGVSQTLQTLRVQLKQGTAIPLVGTKIDPTLEVHRGNFAKRDPGYVRDPKPRLDGVATFMNSRGNHNITIKPFKVDASGHYRIRVHGYALLNDHGKLLPSDRTETVAFYTDSGRLLGRCDLPPNEPATAQTTVWLDRGDKVDYLAISTPSKWLQFPKNDRYAPFAWHHFRSHGVALKWFEMEGPIVDEWPPESHVRLYGGLPLEAAADRGRNYRVTSADPQSDAARLLETFTKQAFRRPLRQGDLDLPLSIVRAKLAAGIGFEEAMIAAYHAVLCSPEFLLLAQGVGELNDWELANRLSYFLWNSPPDQQLMELADRGKLRDPATVRRQVDRMLDNSKSARFVKHFLDYWLDLRNIELTEPDENLYPEYNALLVESMVEETRAYFAEMLACDLGARYVVDSEFVMINQRLATLYNIDGVLGSHIRRVQLPANSLRGGLLTQGSLLKLTANGTTTSPVTRGVFVMDRLLGQPPPPPPAAVPAVEPDLSGATTIRAQLAAHRNDAACASCHARIDPPGFALEGFDVMGAWRDRYRAALGREKGAPLVFAGKPARFKFGQRVDDSGELVGVGKFDDVDGFRELLLTQQRRLAANLLYRLTVYATGAEVSIADRAVLEGILDSSAESEFGVRTMIHHLVQSRLFRRK